MSRQGELWRGEIALHLEEYLHGRLTVEALLDWSMDHPFFDQQMDIDPDERPVIGAALGAILQLDHQEPASTRTTRTDLVQIVNSTVGQPAAHAPIRDGAMIGNHLPLMVESGTLELGGIGRWHAGESGNAPVDLPGRQKAGSSWSPRPPSSA